MNLEAFLLLQWPAWRYGHWCCHRPIDLELSGHSNLLMRVLTDRFNRYATRLILQFSTIFIVFLQMIYFIYIILFKRLIIIVLNLNGSILFCCGATVHAIIKQINVL